jgi:hypothetical protein
VTRVVVDAGTTILAWPDMTAIAARLADAIELDVRPDVVVGILRGGMVPAIQLAHLLELRNVRALDFTHTCADGVNAAKAPRPVLRNPGSLGDLSGMDVLLVDDVAGTGETIMASRSLLNAIGATRVRTAVCVLNEVNWQRHSGQDSGGPDLEDVLTYVGAVHHGWVVFPWEKP